MPALIFRQAVLSDTDRCFEIETSAYEGDEAATHEKIATRIAQYPQGFLVLELDGRIVGFINSGCAHKVVMSDEAFKELVLRQAVCLRPRWNVMARDADGAIAPSGRTLERF